jgi:hypothetical protein
MSDFDPTMPIAVLSAALVAELGEGWSLDTERSMSHGCFLDGPDDVRLFARDVDMACLRGKELGKVEVSGCYPDDATKLIYDLETLKIGVSGRRSPAALARDITRRLVPDVAAEMVEVNEHLARHKAAREARHSRRDQLAATLRGARAHEEVDTATHSSLRHHHDDDGSYGDWTLSYDGSSVAIDARSVPYSKAVRIAAILAE